MNLYVDPLLRWCLASWGTEWLALLNSTATLLSKLLRQHDWAIPLDTNTLTRHKPLNAAYIRVIIGWQRPPEITPLIMAVCMCVCGWYKGPCVRVCVCVAVALGYATSSWQSRFLFCFNVNLICMGMIYCELRTIDSFLTFKCLNFLVRLISSQSCSVLSIDLI